MKYMKFAILLITTFMLNACENSKESEVIKVVSKKSSSEDRAKIYKLKGSEGNFIELKRKNGAFEIVGEEDKTIMFDIFATYCLPCKTEAPELAKIDKKFEKLKVVGLTIEEDIKDEELLNFKKEYGGDYFMTGSKHNDAIIKTLLDDIKYEQALLIPLKIIVKDGKYKSIFSPLNDSKNYYYIGQIYPEMLQKDIEKILGGA